MTTYKDERFKKVVELISEISGVSPDDMGGFSSTPSQLTVTQHVRDKSGHKVIAHDRHGNKLADAQNGAILVESNLVFDLFTEPETVAELPKEE